ncbi:MAG: DUF4397 domain-containing protein [Phycisphaerales bacterium]|nr:DUF4397 domain-containing protein [Phycisphaerales bacterium]
MKLFIPTIVAATALATTAQAGNVRIAHLSPDAPDVDVLVDGNVAFAGVAFNELTGYANLPQGDYLIQVVPAGASKPVVIETVLAVPASGDFTAAAINPLSTITAAVFEDDNQRKPGNTRVRFVHASPGTPAVDIALANGGPVLFSNVAFGESGGYIEVPAGTYDLEARVAGTDTVALSLPGTALSGGTSITVWASGLLKGNPALGVAVSLDVAPISKVRVLHASPDAPSVDIRVNGLTAIQDLSYLENTGYVDLDTGSTNIQVVPSGLEGPVVINATLDLVAADYSVLAIGELADIAPLPLADDNMLADGARIRFVHASPDAPSVDIALADGGPVLFADVSFGTSGGYIEVPGGIYDLEARVAGTDTVALSVPGVNVTGNRVFTVVATGLLSGTPSLNALALLDAEACRTDVNGDAKTSVDDVLAVLTAWSTTDPWADLNGSGTVEVMDLMAVIQSFGVCRSE